MRLRVSLRWPPVASVLALLLLALLIIYLGLLHWWLVGPAWREAQDMRLLRQRQAQNAARLAQAPELMRRLAGLQRLEDQTGDFLPGDDPSTATAGLMQTVVASVARHGGEGRCDVTQKMPGSGADIDGEGFREVRATINLHCDAESLAAILHELEYGHPYIFVSDFMMYRGESATSAEASVEVQFTVSGFLRALRSSRPDAGIAAGEVRR